MIDFWYEEPVVQHYAMVIAALLAVGGVAIGLLRLLGKSIGSVWRTFLGWLIMAPLIVLFFGVGRWTALIFLFFLAIAGVREFARATGLYRDWWMMGVVYLGITLVFVMAFVIDPRRGEPGWYGMFMALPVYVVAMILLVPIAQNRAKGQLQSVSLAILSFVYFGWMFAHLGFLANRPNGFGYLFFLVFAVEINDISAFLFGKLFGQRKLIPNISPNKTVAGSLGAILVSFIMPFVFHFSFPHFTLPELLLTGLIVGVGGQFGDLAISYIKRDIGVKDMGATIPGHGGVLDRIDSLIFVAPVFFHMVRWYGGGAS